LSLGDQKNGWRAKEMFFEKTCTKKCTILSEILLKLT
jgi:hypothetical protein